MRKQATQEIAPSVLVMRRRAMQALRRRTIANALRQDPVAFAASSDRIATTLVAGSEAAWQTWRERQQRNGR
jgi:predicted alpha/beta hydrolase